MDPQFFCIFGGHYGSEGKGSLAEHYATELKAAKHKIAVFGENSPNSGHTCSRGKTKNLPASSFFADLVILGPDSVIDVQALREDLQAITDFHNGWCPQIKVHQHAAMMHDGDKEAEAGVVARVSSTGSGSGAARTNKVMKRDDQYVVKGCEHFFKLNLPSEAGLEIISHHQYMSLLDQIRESDMSAIFECSQGTLLDVNFGRYPFVTSRTTLARSAVERNGLGEVPWQYVGVYRTYPIRTGGPSGPTGGAETTFGKIGVKDEIATVTKRVRRVFEFDKDDFHLSIRLNRPDIICFTHLDYLGIEPWRAEDFGAWLTAQGVDPSFLITYRVKLIGLSKQIGKLNFYTIPQLWP